MDGIHDLGGMQGFRSVGWTADEPPFHESWEGRVHGMMLGLAVSGNLPPGGFRHAIERMEPVHYLTSSYYEHWLVALETLLSEAGTVSIAEIDDAHSRLASSGVAGGDAARGADQGIDFAAVIRSMFGPTGRNHQDGTPRFAPGTTVRVRDVQTPGHTRCPRYVRGRLGTIDRVYRTSQLPDVPATQAPQREPFYAVAFDGAELWGSQAEPGTTVRVDLWESYLEEAGS